MKIGKTLHPTPHTPHPTPTRNFLPHTLVIGKNDGWKQEVNLGKVNNQKLVTIPHARLIDMISYQCQLVGIKVIIQEESYTSVANFLNLDPLPV
jgi:putative transposase